MRQGTTETFKNCFDPNAMMKADIYPRVWDRDPTEECEWLVAYFEELKPFAHESRKINRGMIIEVG